LLSSEKKREKKSYFKINKQEVFARKYICVCAWIYSNRLLLKRTERKSILTKSKQKERENKGEKVKERQLYLN